MKWVIGASLVLALTPELLAGRVPPTVDYMVGVELEAGVFINLPWHRVDAGMGVRHSLVPDPRVQGTLLWAGFTIWPKSR